MASRTEHWPELPEITEGERAPPLCDNEFRPKRQTKGRLRSRELARVRRLAKRHRHIRGALRLALRAEAGKPAPPREVTHERAASARLAAPGGFGGALDGGCRSRWSDPTKPTGGLWDGEVLALERDTERAHQRSHAEQQGQASPV